MTEVGARAILERHAKIEDDPLLAHVLARDVGVEDRRSLDATAEDALEHVHEQRRLVREQELEDDVERGVEQEHRDTGERRAAAR